MNDDLFKKIKQFINEKKDGPGGPLPDLGPDIPPPGFELPPAVPPSGPAGPDRGLASLVGGAPGAPHPAAPAAAPGGGAHLPPNATLDDLISFAKSRPGPAPAPSAPQAYAPPAAPQAYAPPAAPPAYGAPAAPAAAAAGRQIASALPILEEDLDDPDLDLPGPTVTAMRKAAPAPARTVSELPDIDDDLAAPLAPMLDVDRILEEKKKKDEQSLKRLFTLEFLPPTPRSPEETGLEPAFLAELIMKTVYYNTELEGMRIAQELCLPFNGVIEPLVRGLKDENYLEIKGGGSSMAAQWRFQITSKGVEKAHEILQRNGYTGPAPVTIEHYTEMVHRQRIQPEVSLKEVKAAFSDMILNEATLEKIGPAINSAKSAFLYGPPGNGKTSICERMCTLLGGAIFIPYAIEVGGQVIKIHDSYVHSAPEGMDKANLSDGELARMDRRWVICRRPIVIVGGELTLEMLDLTYNEGARFYEAPFQVKSNGGMLLIDDFGRQKVRPRDLLNRWIVPLEKNVDFLTLHTGKKCEIPFDQFIVFSTNLNPSDLVDEAFLRRLRYKIEIENPTAEEFIEIFKRTCAGKGVKFVGAMMKYLLENYYIKEGVSFRACHARDLIDQIIDRARYRKIKPQLTPELIDHAWKSYFVKL